MARRKRTNELTAGLFVILGLAGVIGVVVWLGASGWLRASHQRVVFYARMDGGQLGLQEGSDVKVNDAEVGQVKRIETDPRSGRTYYHVDIEHPDVRVYANAAAQAGGPLIGGASIVIRNTGDPNQPLADAEHPVELAGGLTQAFATLAGTLQEELDKSDRNALLGQIDLMVRNLAAETDPGAAEGLMARMRTSAATMNEITARVNRELSRGGDSLLSRILDFVSVALSAGRNVERQSDPDVSGSLMAKVRTSATDLTGITGSIRTQTDPNVTDSAMHNLVHTTRNLREFSEEEIADILTKLRDSNTEILKVTRDLSAVTGEVRTTVMVHRDNIDSLIDNMAQVSSNLKAASQEIRRAPWRLLHRPEDRELKSQNIYDAARSFAEGATQLDQAVAKLQGLAADAPEGIRADDPMLQRVREQLQESFQKFNKAEQALWEELQQ
jgi:ABC-type transporter Mla subunit MlaD